MSKFLQIAMLILCTGLLGLGVGGAQAQETCANAATAFDQARSAGGLDAIVSSFADLQAAGCSEQVVHCAGNGVALAYVEAAYAQADAGAALGAVKRELLDGKAYGAPWQLLVGLADLSLDQGRAAKDASAFAEAATYFQDALNTISEPPICTDASGMPGKVEIAAIYNRMTVAQSLAPQFEMVRTRAGGCGGVFLQSIRGFTPTFRPLPINFIFDKADFTDSGEKAASVLLACLKEEGRERVILSGHTDAKGAAAYNMGLSERRLARVAEYLEDGGFEGEMVLVAKGESEPFEADDPTAYSEDEIDQLNRRVVLRETAE